MQDHTQAFEEAQKATFVLRDNSISYSFIASFSDDSELLEDSILSIEHIGFELGVDYEILVPVMNNIHAAVLKRLSAKVKTLKPMKFSNGIAGVQKSAMQAASIGSYIVLFDPSRIYGVEFADLLHSFSTRMDEVVLFSDLLVIPSAIFRRIGTWKGLRSAEDLDILARISGITGLIAYNPPDIELKVLSNMPLLLRSGRSGLSIRHLYNLILKQRDQITGSRYSVDDIMKFYRMARRRHPVRLLLTLFSYLISGIWSTKSFKGTENNYSTVLDRLLESLILGDFRRYPDFVLTPKLSISKKDLNFLKETGKVWGKIVDDLDKYVILRDDTNNR